jgi:hypothetical protein
MRVEIKRYAEDSFKVLFSWQAELADVLQDEGCSWTPNQQGELEEGLPVWLNNSLVVKKVESVKDHIRKVMKGE